MKKLAFFLQFLFLTINCFQAFTQENNVIPINNKALEAAISEKNLLEH